MDQAAKQQLKKFLKELRAVKGRHTELVSVYIPAGYNLDKIIAHLQEEQSTAKNIKDAKTRSNVIDSLEKCVRHLRLFKRTPANGYAVFAGNTSAQEGKVTIQVWGIEPPEPLNTRIYRCDQRFVLDILEGMLEHKEMYGLIVMDRREATLGFLKGTSITATTHTTSGVPGKHRAGGQCLSPETIVKTDRLVDIQYIKKGDNLQSLNLQTKKVEDTLCLDKWEVTKDELFEITYLNTKIKTSGDHTFFVYQDGEIQQKAARDLRVSDQLLDNQLNKIKIQSITPKKGTFTFIDIATKNQNFFANNILVHNSAQRFERLIEGVAKDFYKKVADLCNKEFLGVKELKGILLGGPGPTKESFKEYLNNELQQKLIAVQDITYTDESGLHHLVEKSKDVLQKELIAGEKKIMERFFTLLAKEIEKTAYGKGPVEQALQMGAVELLLLSEDLADAEMEHFEELAKTTNTEIKLISVDTKEGQQLRDLGGIAAILRYALVQ